MGTRGHVKIKVDGQTFTAYNHFDSYPSGLGNMMLAQAKRMDPAWVRERAASLRVVQEDDRPTVEQAEKVAAYTDHGVSTGADWYSALREAQGNVEAYLTVGFWPDGSRTGGQEYTYTIDYDSETFTVEAEYEEVYQKYSLHYLPETLLD